MSLSIGIFASTLLSTLRGSPYNYSGTKLSTFCTAVATGVVSTSTLQLGHISTPINIGPSTGVGIIITGSNVANGIKSKAVSLFGYTGTELQSFCTVLGTITQAQFALATLISDSNGIARFSSFTIAESAMASAIQSAAPSFTGSQWPNFCTAIAHGICTEIGSNGIGALAGAVGAGTGTGIVSIS